MHPSKVRTRVLSFTALAALFSAVVLGPAVAAGATYYVDPVSGNDSNGGTSTVAAYRTITEAMDAADSGTDTVVVLPGECSTATGETFPIGLPTVGVRLVSSGGAGVTTIRGNGAHQLLWTTCGPGTVVRGFTLTGGGGDVAGGAMAIAGIAGSSHATGFPVVVDNRFVGNKAYSGGQREWRRVRRPVQPV